MNLLTFSSDKVKYHEVLLVPIDLEVVVERQLGKVAHLGLDGVEVEGCSPFQQEQKLVVGDPGRVQVNLQGQKKREQKFVTLIQA